MIVRCDVKAMAAVLTAGSGCTQGKTNDRCGAHHSRNEARALRFEHTAQAEREATHGHHTQEPSPIARQRTQTDTGGAIARPGR
jgi:hypothetical protein